ncbi:unnamed protein product [Closterium sp. Naga37s-1]|nr:unnamed protein product [Closterium sp. Naga37s-1]
MVSAKKKTSKVAEDSPAAEVAEDSPAAEDAAATEEKTPVAAEAAESAGDGESAAEAKASADEGEKAEGEEAKSAPAAEEAAKDENEGEGEDTTGADAAAAGDGEDPPPGSQLEQDIIKAEKKAGDIFPAGACKKEIKSFCEGVDVGNRSLERCLSDSFKLTKAADAASADKKFGKKCLKAIRRFKIEVYKDISIDKEMMEVCKDDISSLCDDDFLYPEVGSVLACLREAKSGGKISEACGQKVFEAQQDAANDFALDPQLNETCSGDVQRLCADVPTGEGRVQDCLRDHRNSLNWECLAELFRQEIESSEDIRLNTRLFKACLEDKRRFCPDVLPGDARVKDCLESHLHDSDFSKTCKVEFEHMMERRASDFRLDFNLRKYCAEDISTTCYQDAEDVVDVANRDAKVIECLQDYRGELKDPRCRQQVHQLTKRASEDIRFNRPLAQACKDDSAKLCKDVPPGHARVLLCLQEHRKGLTANCKEALFQEEVRFAEDIDFKFPLRQACTDEMKILCKDQPDVIKCLQDKVEDADMGVLCKEEVKKDMKRAAEDYRLNFRLNKECFVDVERLCLHSCDAALETGGTETGVTCGGATLKCLTENERKLSSKTCRQELFYFKKRMVADISLDIPLQMACKNDVEKKCGGERDHSKALACLRAKRDELTEECKEEELRLSEMEASDIRLTPTLMNACGLELNHFCRGVHPTTGLAFRCLQMSINEDNGVARYPCAVRLKVTVWPWQTPRPPSLPSPPHQGRSRPPNLPPRLLLQAGLGALPEQCEGTPLPLLLVNPTLLLYPSPPPHQVGMSVACKAEVDLQTFRHASYYKLDSALAEQCEGDVDSFCKGVDEGKEAHSLVLQCLVQHQENLSGKCLTETAYAVRMALWMYHKDADLVKPCNPVVEELCGNRTGVVAGEGAGKAGAAAAVGVVGQCLLEQPKEKLGEECGRLVGLIGQPGGHVGGVIDTSQLEETLAQLAQVQLKHEVDAETEGEGGGGGKLVLTGATAFAAVTALTAVLLGAAYLVYRKCFDPTRNYTLMVKAGDV